MNTAKLVESIDADKFISAEAFVNRDGQMGVRFILKDNEGFVVGKHHYTINYIEVYEQHFDVLYTWSKIQHRYNPLTEESGEQSLSIAIDRFGEVNGDITHEDVAEFYYYEIWEYLEAYVQPDY